MVKLNPESKKPTGGGDIPPPTNADRDIDAFVRTAAAENFRHPNSQKFHDLLVEAGELHDRKQKDYGKDNDPFRNLRASEDWGIRGWIGACVRMTDKVKRLQSFANKGTLANESARDSLMDIAVYALIAVVLMEEETAQTEMFYSSRVEQNNE